MKNLTLGYARVSTESQNLDRQLDALKKYGVDIIFNEKMSGTKRDRPELKKMLERMTIGDSVIIESLSRLGRSVKDLMELIELLSSISYHNCHHLTLSCYNNIFLISIFTVLTFIYDMIVAILYINSNFTVSEIITCNITS